MWLVGMLALCVSQPATDDAVAPEPLTLAPNERVAEPVVDVAPAATVEVVPVQAATASIEQAEPATTTAPWAPSRIGFREAATAISANKGYDLHYNPRVVSQLKLRPHWNFNEQVYLRGAFDLLSEHTQNDWTNDRLYVGDLSLNPGINDFYQIPVVGIDVGLEGTLILPTSKPSRGESLRAGTGLDVSLSRKFDLLSGLTVSYDAGVNKNWHAYTTSDPVGKLGACALGVSSACASSQIGSGARNISWDTSHSVAVEVAPLHGFSGMAMLGGTYARLYPVSGNDDLVSYRYPNAANAYFFTSSVLEVRYAPVSLLTVAVGESTLLANQLGTSGTYRTPFINRFTQLYLELRLNIEETLKVL